LAAAPPGKPLGYFGLRIGIGDIAGHHQCHVRGPIVFRLKCPDLLEARGARGRNVIVQRMGAVGMTLGEYRAIEGLRRPSAGVLR